MSETDTMTLADWLLEQIAEDEAVARAAMEGFTTGEWTEDGGSIYAGHGAREVVDWVYEEAQYHIARHDPARVLAECAAKRRIVELCADARNDWDNEADFILAALAQPYADRPGWRGEWAL